MFAFCVTMTITVEITAVKCHIFSKQEMIAFGKHGVISAFTAAYLAFCLPHWFVEPVSFKLPIALPGRYLRVDMYGAHQTQEMDSKYYICLQHVYAVGSLIGSKDKALGIST